jgi:putative oxidoreductase
MEHFRQSFDLTEGFNLLRIVCGAFLIPHLFVKFRNQDFVRGFMSKAGLNPPGAWLYGAFAIEIIASIGLILDIGTAYAAGLAGMFLLVAAWASWKTSAGKWMWNFGGAEYPLFWAICCFVVAMQAMAGSGAAS